LQIFKIVSDFVTKDHYKFIRDHIDEIKNYHVDYSPILFEPIFLPYATELFNNSMTFNENSQKIVKDFCGIFNPGSYEKFFEILAYTLELQLNKPNYITFLYTENPAKSFEAIFSNFRTFIGLDVGVLINENKYEITQLIKNEIDKDYNWYAFLFLMIRFYYKRQDYNTRKVEISIDGTTYKPLEIYQKILDGKYPILSYICHSFPIIYLEWTKEKTLSSYIQDIHKFTDINLFLPFILKKGQCGKVLNKDNLNSYVLSKIIFSIDLSGEEYQWEVYKSLFDGNDFPALPKYLQYIRSIQLMNNTYDNFDQLQIKSIEDFINVKDINSNLLYDTNLTSQMKIIPFNYENITLINEQPNVLQNMFDPFNEQLENVVQNEINVDISIFQRDISLQGYLDRIYKNVETSKDLWEYLIKNEVEESMSKFNLISATLISIYKLYKQQNNQEKINIHFKLLRALIDPFSSFKSFDSNNPNILYVFLYALSQSLSDLKKKNPEDFPNQLNLKVLEISKKIGIKGPFNYRIVKIKNNDYLVYPRSYIPSFVNIIWYDITFSPMEEKKEEKNYQLLFHLMEKRNVFAEWRPFIYLSMVVLELRKTGENFPIEQSEWETRKEKFFKLMDGDIENFINSEDFKEKWKRLKLDNVYSIEEMKNWILSHNQPQKIATKDILNDIAAGFVQEHNCILDIIEFDNKYSDDFPISFITPEMTYFFLDFETFVGYIILKTFENEQNTDFRHSLKIINSSLKEAINYGAFSFVKFAEGKPFIY